MNVRHLSAWLVVAPLLMGRSVRPLRQNEAPPIVARMVRSFKAMIRLPLIRTGPAAPVRGVSTHVLSPRASFPRLALLAATLGACLLVTDPTEKLTLDVRVDPAAVLQGQPVTITAHLVNRTRGTLVVHGSSSCILGFQVFDTAGDPLITSRVCTADLHRFVFAPGDSLKRTGSWSTASAPAGIYTVRPWLDAQEGERLGGSVPFEVLGSDGS